MKAELPQAFRRYLKQVDRKLSLPKEMRQRICADLESTISARLENNMTEAEILAELGDPADIAAEFNTQMAAPHHKKSPLRFVCLAAAILSGLVLVGKLIANLLVAGFINGMARSVGIIGGADGPTSIFVTASVSDGFDGGLIFWLLLLIAGITGFCLLNRSKNKEDKE